MKILEQMELRGIISQGRLTPEDGIIAMLDEFEAEHPGVYRVIYGEPSDAIASINKDMANLYLDLSCDVVWVFSHVFGKPPEVRDEEEWILRHLSLIDAELKSLTTEISMNDKFRDRLQRRFVRRSIEANVQLELLKYLEGEVLKYASFKKPRKRAVKITNNLLFVLVRLMGELYNTEVPKAT
jgi:hypothetical protein